MACFGFAAACVFATPRLALPQSRESFDLQVPFVTTPIPIEGRQWLIYELHLTNFSRDPLRPIKAEILDAPSDDVLVSYDTDALATHLAAISGLELKDQIIRPGQRAVLYVEAPLAATKNRRELRHRITYVMTTDNDVGQVIGGGLTVPTTPSRAVGPPLHGGPWAAVYHWEWPRGHRRVFYTLEGRARLPGRFAIDWVKLDQQGRLAQGDSDRVKNAFGYGVDVIAVADARVADLRDTVQESELVSANPEHPLAEASGNYVSLDLGGGLFAIYEHLKPHSIRVARGQRVKRGQVLASLGFTGDSTGPHLHFHVADSASPLTGEGVPFVFDGFRVLGHYDDVANLDQSPWLEPESARSLARQHERPGPNVVLTFDGVGK